MSCYICGSCNAKSVILGVRDNPKLNVLECPNCGLVYLDSFDHIDDNLYKESRMPGGLWHDSREAERDEIRRFEFCKELVRNKVVLDFGAGNCGFLKKVQSVASRVVGIDLDQEVHNRFQDTLELYHYLSEVKDIKFDIITGFHVIEHLKDPRNKLRKMENLLADGGQIIIETPNANDALINLYSCRAFAKFTYWSCHLMLFSEMSLGMLAHQVDLCVKNKLQIQRYPFSNHMNWIVNGKPSGYKNNWAFLDDTIVGRFYAEELARNLLCDTILYVFSKRNE